MSRIELHDTVFATIDKMGGGNPGALSVVMDMMTQGPQIDPDNFMGGLGPILFMDTLGIYESRIWVLYKDVCKENVSTTICILRAVQMGFLSEAELSFAIDNYGEGIDVDAECAKVTKKLPNFQLVIGD